MILVGNQRGRAKNLAQHLLKEENEHVEVHELRGFASENPSRDKMAAQVSQRLQELKAAHDRVNALQRAKAAGERKAL